MTDFLFLAFVFLVSGVVAVPLAVRLGLGSVVGYLIAGILIAPVLALLNVDVISIQHFSEFGVVILMFLIGLDVKPRQLWANRGRLIGLGGGQVLATTLAIAAVAMAFGQPWTIALAIGLILALSSTAIVMQTLRERGLERGEGGQSSLSVLLTQDIAVIPILALMPLLAAPSVRSVGSDAHHGSDDHGASMSLVDGLAGWQTTLVTLFAIGIVVISGRYLTVPVFRFVAASGLKELFTSVALLLVIGISLLMSLVGLSPALGVFLAGVVLAESEYRHEIEALIDPFRSLLLGLFFMTVGAWINFALLSSQFGLIAGMVLGLILLKAGVLFCLAWAFRIKGEDRWIVTFGLAQAGEFGFVLLSFAVANAVIPSDLAAVLLLVVAISMLATPFLFFLADRLTGRERRGARAWAGDTVVFLSYSRKDDAAMAALTQVLEDRGFEVTSDARHLPGGVEWQNQLSYLIRRADVVIWLASPNSVTSKWCNWELGEVARFRKKLLPVVVGQVAPGQLPSEIGRLQLLPGQGVFNVKRRDHIAALEQFLGSDLDWIKEYSRLADRAHAWDEAARDRDRLLSTAELREAETWQNERPPLAPDPEPLLLDYIHQSRIAVNQAFALGTRAQPEA